MHPVKRLEIIASEIDRDTIAEILKESGALGFTVFEHLAGWGDRGPQLGDEVSGSSGNICVVCFCDEKVADAAVEKLRPILDFRGGLCAVADATLACSSHLPVTMAR